MMFQAKFLANVVLRQSSTQYSYLMHKGTQEQNSIQDVLKDKKKLKKETLVVLKPVKAACSPRNTATLRSLKKKKKSVICMNFTAQWELKPYEVGRNQQNHQVTELRCNSNPWFITGKAMWNRQGSQQKPHTSHEWQAVAMNTNSTRQRHHQTLPTSIPTEHLLTLLTYVAKKKKHGYFKTKITATHMLNAGAIKCRTKR